MNLADVDFTKSRVGLCDQQACPIFSESYKAGAREPLVIEVSELRKVFVVYLQIDLLQAPNDLLRRPEKDMMSADSRSGK